MNRQMTFTPQKRHSTSADRINEVLSYCVKRGVGNTIKKFNIQPGTITRYAVEHQNFDFRAKIYSKVRKYLESNPQ